MYTCAYLCVGSKVTCTKPAIYKFAICGENFHNKSSHFGQYFHSRQMFKNSSKLIVTYERRRSLVMNYCEKKTIFFISLLQNLQYLDIIAVTLKVMRLKTMLIS